MDVFINVSVAVVAVGIVLATVIYHATKRKRNKNVGCGGCTSCTDCPYCNGTCPSRGSVGKK